MAQIHRALLSIKIVLDLLVVLNIRKLLAQFRRVLLQVMVTLDQHLVAGQAADFLVISPLGTVATVLVKGTLCGLIAGLVYTALSKKNRWIAILVAAVVCPVVNTGVFLLGCLLFFMDTLNGWAAALGYESAGAYMVLGLAGTNFLLEIGVNVVLAPVISRLIAIGKKK